MAEVPGTQAATSNASLALYVGRGPTAVRKAVLPGACLCCNRLALIDPDQRALEQRAASPPALLLNQLDGANRVTAIDVLDVETVLRHPCSIRFPPTETC